MVDFPGYQYQTRNDAAYSDELCQIPPIDVFHSRAFAAAYELLPYPTVIELFIRPPATKGHKNQPGAAAWREACQLGLFLAEALDGTLVGNPESK